MNNPVNFLLESGISLALLALIYILFLRNETFFRLNRFFLLGSLLFSVLLPMVKLRIYEPEPVLLSEITVTPYRNLMEAVTIYGHEFSATVEQTVLSASLLAWVYLSGLVIFLALFFYRLARIILVIRKNQVIKSDGVNLVLLANECSPFSFLNYVFMSRSLQNSDGYNRMMAHEIEHVKQGHSFDALILELLTAFQWFNPFMWLLRRAIRENHEFLADRAVLTSGVSRGTYKKLLLNQFSGGQLVLTNNFNYSLIKNRIKMMSRMKSPKIAPIKIIWGILTAFALIIVFACEQKVSVEPTPVEEENVATVKSTIVDDGKIKIEGDAETLEKYKAMFSDLTAFEFVTDSLGDEYLIRKKAIQPKSLNPDEQIFFMVENMPEFPGGEQALRTFIANSIKYPSGAQANGIQGRVYVTFVVNKNGDVADAKIARGVDPSLDQEALRVINDLPRWLPGKQKGQVVNVSYTLPINFVLQ